MEKNLILSIDPGSIRAGWCIMEQGGGLVDGGVLVPENFKAANHVRVNGICEDLRGLLDEFQPGIILLEWVTGHVGRRRHKGGGAGLTVYGLAVGSLWREIVHWKKSLPAEERSGIEIVLINEILWTGGIDKFSRATAITNLFPRYNIKKDPGMDLADSIGLAVWFLKDRKIRSGNFDA